MRRVRKLDEEKLCQRFVKMFGCDAARISNPLGVQMFLILGVKRNTRKDEGQWYKNGKPIHFTYLAEKVIASGSTQKELIASAREYKRLEGMTMTQFLEREARRG